MKINWNYPTSVWVGENRIKDLSEACKNLNISKPLFVTDKDLINLDMTKKIILEIKKKFSNLVIFSNFSGNPIGENVDEGVLEFKKKKCDDAASGIRHQAAGTDAGRGAVRVHGAHPEDGRLHPGPRRSFQGPRVARRSGHLGIPAFGPGVRKVRPAGSRGSRCRWKRSWCASILRRGTAGRQCELAWSFMIDRHRRRRRRRRHRRRRYCGAVLAPAQG